MALSQYITLHMTFIHTERKKVKKLENQRLHLREKTKTAFVTSYPSELDVITDVHKGALPRVNCFSEFQSPLLIPPTNQKGGKLVKEKQRY